MSHRCVRSRFCLDLFEMAINFLSKCHTVLSVTLQLINFIQVFLLTAVLCIFCDLDVGLTVSDSDCLDEIRAVSD